MEEQTLVMQPNAEDDLIRRRQALASAVNAHDVEALKDFVDPSYEAKSALGVTWKYQDILDSARMTFRSAQDFTESVEIESLEIQGDTALLTTTRRDNYTLFRFLKKREDTRQVETWRLIEGKWRIVAEKLLDHHANLSFSSSGR